MREIKFRGKTRKGYWKYGLPFYAHGTGEWKITNSNGWQPSYSNPDEGESTEYHNIDAYTLGQFTELLDKNGKEIYEGDIIQVNGETKKYYDDNLFEPPEAVEFELLVEVVYNDSIASFDLHTIEPDLNMKHWGFFGEDTNGHLQIIGNIHENPELLNN